MKVCLWVVTTRDCVLTIIVAFSATRSREIRPCINFTARQIPCAVLTDKRPDLLPVVSIPNDASQFELRRALQSISPKLSRLTTDLESTIKPQPAAHLPASVFFSSLALPRILRCFHPVLTNTPARLLSPCRSTTLKPPT